MAQKLTKKISGNSRNDSVIYNPKDDTKRKFEAEKKVANELQRFLITKANELAYYKAKLEQQNLISLTDEEAEKQGLLAAKKQALEEKNLADKLSLELKNSQRLYEYTQSLESAGITMSAEQKQEYLDYLAEYDRAEQFKNQRAIKEQKKKDAKELAKMELENTLASLADQETSIKDKFKTISKAFGEVLKQVDWQHTFDNLFKSLTSGFDQIIDSYASMQLSVNARLQGSENEGFSRLEGRLNSYIGIQPYVKNQKLIENLSNLVNEGIAYNVEQRAFLQTISEGIATTFDATTDSLKRIVRLQQSDSTAARLGLEAFLTRYFNSMFENTEYLSSQFDNVAANLFEASAQMTSDNAVAFEYVAQKWLGSLSSLGLSSEAVQSIATALGYLGSGNISALSSNQPLQNLLVMSANESGTLDFASLLTEGLDASSTNTLLESMVKYLQEIASTENNVVRSEYAQLFGLSASDLIAIKNLSASDIKNISDSMLSYSDSISELYAQVNTLPTRYNISSLLDTLWSNLQFSLGTDIAKNPALYALWEVTSLISDTTGGISVPTIGTMLGFVDLETTLDNLMKTSIVGVSSLGMIGDIINGLANSILPSNMLTNLGISNSVSTRVRGSGLGTSLSGLGESQEYYISNSDGGDLAESTLSSAKDEANKQLDILQKEENYLKNTYDYLTITFDKKMDVILTLLGINSGANAGAISAYAKNYSSANISENLSSLDTLWLTVGKNSASVASPSSESSSISNTLSSTLGEIRDIMNSGVKVIIDSDELERVIRNAVSTAMIM